MTNVPDVALQLLIEMMRRSGVQVWESDTATRTAMVDAAIEMAKSLSEAK